MAWKKASDAERQQEAERRIAEARREGSRQLDLGDLGLSRLPESLAELVDLEELALGRWSFGEDGRSKWSDGRPEPTFDSLAPLTQLKELRRLLLGPCAATSLEPVFALNQLQNLTIWDCDGFSGELASLAGLSQLQSLRIEYCAGFSGELASLAGLSQLQSLMIAGCAGFSGELASLAGLSLRDSGQRTLARADYERLGAEVDSFVSPEHALDYFHQTGVVFYQPGLFGGQIVLDQSWALEAVYSVFQRAKALPALRERGLFTRKDLEVLCWEGKSLEEQRLFLDLMESCQICFVQTWGSSEKETVYLAPDLLPPYEKVEPQLFAWFADPAEVTSLRVEYRFLHQAVLRSLISGVGSNVGPNAVYWKYGLWFRTASGSQLLIRQEAANTFAGPGAGTIVLSAKGPDSLSLLRKAHKQLEQQAVHEKPTETLELAGVRVPRSALDACVDNKVRTRDGRLVEARPFEAFFAGKLEDMKTESRIDAAPLPKPEVFLSYAWGDDESPEGRQRAEAADRLCDELRRDFVVHRDRDAIQPGESISDYIDKLTHGRYLVALVSDKYLRSPYCMFEIYKLYQACQGEKKQLLERVVPVVLPEVKIARLLDRAPYLEYWSEEAERYEALLRNSRLRLGPASMKEHNLVRDFANHVDEILVFIADVLMPRRTDDFSVVRETLLRKMGLD